MAESGDQGRLAAWVTAELRKHREEQDAVVQEIAGRVDEISAQVKLELSTQNERTLELIQQMREVLARKSSKQAETSDKLWKRVGDLTSRIESYSGEVAQQISGRTDNFRNELARIEGRVDDALSASRCCREVTEFLEHRFEAVRQDVAVLRTTARCADGAMIAATSSTEDGACGSADDLMRGQVAELRFKVATMDRIVQAIPTHGTKIDQLMMRFDELGGDVARSRDGPAPAVVKPTDASSTAMSPWIAEVGRQTPGPSVRATVGSSPGSPQRNPSSPQRKSLGGKVGALSRGGSIERGKDRAQQPPMGVRTKG